MYFVNLVKHRRCELRKTIGCIFHLDSDRVQECIIVLTLHNFYFIISLASHTLFRVKYTKHEIFIGNSFRLVFYGGNLLLFSSSFHLRNGTISILTKNYLL